MLRKRPRAWLDRQLLRIPLYCHNRFLWKAVLVDKLEHLLMGLAFLFGPSAAFSSPAFNEAKEFLGIQVWGVLFTFSAVVGLIILLVAKSRSGWGRIALVLGLSSILDFMFVYWFSYHALLAKGANGVGSVGALTWLFIGCRRALDAQTASRMISMVPFDDRLDDDA